MKRKVYLIGEMEKLFGSEFSMYSDTYSDIIKNIDCNRPGFRKYILDCYEKGVGFTINFAGKDIDEKELFTPIKEGDVTIAAIPAGSKSDVGKVITGIFLLWLGGGLPGGYAGLGGAAEAGVGAWINTALQGYGIFLASTGVQGMLAPDPGTDMEKEEGYLYTGSEKIVVEGDPVPLLYGELRVPGQPINVAMNRTNNSANFASYTQQLSTDPVSVSTQGISHSTMTVEEYNISEQLMEGLNPWVNPASYGSDIRLKENIRPLGKFNGVNIYSWDWNEKGMELWGEQPTVGVIAQEVIKTNPDAAWLENGYYVVDYNKALGAMSKL